MYLKHIYTFSGAMSELKNTIKYSYHSFCTLLYPYSNSFVKLRLLKVLDVPKKWSESCPTLCNPNNCSLPGLSIHGVFQAGVLEWGAIAFSVFSCLVMSNSLRHMDCSMSGLSLPHHLLEFAQVHIHYIGDAIQPSHPLSPSSSAFNLHWI